ncbi:Fur family transcriptional regulator [Anatilimnocola aggregata]|nr:transcriptional repressor [Anatilimnocola aggregata]
MGKDETAGLSVQQAREMLRAADLRSTASRLAVLQYLANFNKPLSHAEVADALVPQGYDKSTLYRCLVELADSNLLSRLDAGDHAWRFELRRTDEHEDGQHPHFMCLDCGKVTCLPEVEVKIVPSSGKKTGMMGDVTEIFLKGHCTECK